MQLTGADVLMRTFERAGVEVCFANPGTSEMEIVRSFEGLERLRPILCLFEGVATGAADGYSRMSGRPALTLTHLGPGFANGIANLHNARRAHSCVINLVGQNPIAHSERYDVGLNTNIAALAGPVSLLVETVKCAEDIEASALRALEASTDNGGAIVTLTLPTDVQSAPVSPSSNTNAIAERTYAAADEIAIERVAANIQSGKAVSLLIDGNGAGVAGQRAGAAIAQSYANVRLYLATFGARFERGWDLPPVGKLPYLSEPALAALAGADFVVLAGAAPPATYFSRPGLPDEFAPPGSLDILARPCEDAEAALVRLCEILEAAPWIPPQMQPADEMDSDPSEALTAESASRIIAAQLPDGAIVSMESPCCGAPFGKAQLSAKRHTALSLTGGAIGQGLPVALGAQVACPDRPVYALQSDGSGMYTVQALWTIAKLGLPVTILLIANNRYEILNMELRMLGIQDPSADLRNLIDLTEPAIDWVAVARGLGVEACAVTTCGELKRALGGRDRATAPLLIQVNI